MQIIGLSPSVASPFSFRVEFLFPRIVKRDRLPLRVASIVMARRAFRFGMAHVAGITCNTE